MKNHNDNFYGSQKSKVNLFLKKLEDKEFMKHEAKRAGKMVAELEKYIKLKVF